MLDIISIFWRWISNQGNSSLLTDREKKKVILTNQLSIIGSFLSITYAFYYYKQYSVPHLYILEGAFFIIYLLPIILNSLYLHSAAKIILILIAVVNVFINASSLGRENGEQLIFIPIFFLIILFFDFSEKNKLLNTTAVTLFFIVLLEITDYQLFYTIEVSSEVHRANYIANLTLSVSLSFIAGYYFFSITEEFQRSLITTQEYLKTIFNNSYDAIFVINKNDNTIIDCNRRATDLFDSPGKEFLIGKNYKELQKVASAPDEVILFYKEILEKKRWSKELEFKTFKGEVFWGSLAMTVIEVQEGTTYLMRITDITDKKISEQKIRKSEAGLIEAQQMAHLGNYEFYLSNNTFYASNQLYRIFQLPYQYNFKIEEGLNFIHREDREIVYNQIRTAVEKRSSYDFEVRALKANGTYGYIHALGQFEEDPVEGTKIIGTVQDITQKKKAEHELERSKNLFQLAIEASNDGIWEYNATTGEMHFSHRFQEMLGYYENDLPNTLESLINALVPEDREINLKRFKDFKEGKISEYKSINRFNHKYGSIVFVMAKAICERDKDGNLIRVVGSHTDITSDKLSEIHLIEAKNQAEFASKAKSNFLSNMSHEVRTPLNEILGFTEILSTTSLNDSQKGYLDLIRSSGQTLSNLLKDILELNKLEEGKLLLERVSFNLKELINSTLSPYQYIASDKSLFLNVFFEENIPDTNVFGDSIRLKQILINLVSNSLKFTERGGINITFKLSSKDTLSNSHFILQGCVTDTGNGISKDKQKAIFENCTPSDDSFNRKPGCSGVGLTIVKELVRLMGGSLTIESPVTNQDSSITPGTSICFSIKLTLDTEIQIKPKAKEVGSQYLFKKAYQILVVEDNELIQSLAASILKKAGLNITIVNNGKLAVESVQQNKYDAILMDIQMPVMDGYEATRQIRKSNPLIPIIALSANCYKEDVDRALKAGMNCHLGKPFTQKEVFDCLEKYLEVPFNRITNSNSIK